MLSSINFINIDSIHEHSIHMVCPVHCAAVQPHTKFMGVYRSITVNSTDNYHILHIFLIQQFFSIYMANKQTAMQRNVIAEAGKEKQIIQMLQK